VADKPGGGMFDIICLLGDTQMPHRIEDTTEGGQVMVTTIIAPQLSKEPLMYFRTKERCQQEMRERAAAYKAGQQQRERQLDRYR
jgi:hypothetical protein